jgi:hypothetical protein
MSYPARRNGPIAMNLKRSQIFSKRWRIAAGYIQDLQFSMDALPGLTVMGTGDEQIDTVKQSGMNGAER